MGMTYLLGYWPTDCRTIAGDGRRRDADLYQACLIFHCRLIARACQSSSGYGPLWTCTLVALWSLSNEKIVENVKLRQIIAKIDFLLTFQQKENVFENLTSGCHGNAFFGVTSKSTQFATINFLVSMETLSHDNSDKIKQIQKRNLWATSYKKTALEYLSSNQNDSFRSEKLMKW